MLKTISALIIAVLVTGTVNAQRRTDRPLKVKTANTAKTFDLTLTLDSSIDPKRAYIQYDNGKQIQLFKDTIGLTRVVHVREKYYAPLATFQIHFLDSAHYDYIKEFFIGDKPASVTIHLTPGTDHELLYSKAQNITPVFDSLDHKKWGRFISQRKVGSKTEAAALENFVERNPNYHQSDSLKKLFNQLYKAYIRRDMSYEKQNPDYYSFWLFAHQSSQLDGLLRRDTAFLKEQLHFLKTAFPTIYTNNEEGRYLIERFERKIKASPLRQSAPAFTVTGVDGKKISLIALKGRYVLLDFWATWCGPCMMEMPFVKSIREKYDASKLGIIGVSSDKNRQNLLAGIQKNNMTWPQYLDDQGKIKTLYNIDSIPVLILLDKEGNIIYRQNGYSKSGEEELSKLLARLN